MVLMFSDLGKLLQKIIQATRNRLQAKKVNIEGNPLEQYLILTFGIENS